MVDLIEGRRVAVEDLIDVLGRASIEAVVGLSVRRVAGEGQQGKARPGDAVWHGTQAGRACQHAGQQQRFWRGRRSTERSWAAAICGP